MPLYINDDETAERVARLAQRRGISKQDAVKLAVHAELDRVAEKMPFRERFAALRAEHPLPRRTGKKADEALPSALEAIVAGEEGADALADRLGADDGRLCSAVAARETVAGLRRSHAFSIPAARESVECFLGAGAFKVVGIGERECNSRSMHTHGTARDGTGPRSTWATASRTPAKANGAKLLYKGEAFRKTDLA